MASRGAKKIDNLLTNVPTKFSRHLPVNFYSPIRHFQIEARKISGSGLKVREFEQIRSEVNVFGQQIE